MAFIAYIHNHPEVSVLCGFNVLETNERWKVHPKTELILATDNGTPWYRENYSEMINELNFQKGDKRYINPNTKNSCGFFALTLDNIPRDRFIFSNEIQDIPESPEVIVRRFPSQCGLNLLQNPSKVNKDSFTQWKKAKPSIGWICILSNDDEHTINHITDLGFIPTYYLSKKTIYFYWSK